MMDNEKIIRKKVFVYGAVQGVGFRYRAEHAANMLGVTGWVRNEPDGSVLLEVQGTDEQIDKVLAMVNQGTYVNIDRITANQIPIEERVWIPHKINSAFLIEKVVPYSNKVMPVYFLVIRFR